MSGTYEFYKPALDFATSYPWWFAFGVLVTWWVIFGRNKS